MKGRGFINQGSASCLLARMNTVGTKPDTELSAVTTRALGKEALNLEP